MDGSIIFPLELKSRTYEALNSHIYTLYIRQYIRNFEPLYILNNEIYKKEIFIGTDHPGNECNAFPFFTKLQR